jgi:hypothetical protein
MKKEYIPGAPANAVLTASETILGASSAFVTRCANLVNGRDATTWSIIPCSELFSASRSGGDEVIHRIGERSASAVARPGMPLEKLYVEIRQKTFRSR